MNIQCTMNTYIYKYIYIYIVIPILLVRTGFEHLYYRILYVMKYTTCVSEDLAN